MATAPSRFLLLGYCFADMRGQAQIGVYKRCIRVGLELVERGHEVVLFCTGRDNFHDELTARAAERFEFIDIPYHVAEPAAVTAPRFHAALRRVAPDVVVVGEAPLTGTLLEGTLAAVELGIPAVILDNAYSRDMVGLFVDSIGPIADGLVLTGPSSTHARRVPRTVCQVAPLIAPDRAAAGALVADLGLDPDRIVAILGYDPKAAALGLSLAPALAAAGAGVVLVSRDPAAASAGVATLPGAAAAAVRVVAPLPEEVFFGLLGLSRLAVVKYGFMQLTECLALRTPVIAAFHDGATWVDTLPKEAKAFVHVTGADAADEATVAAALGFLSTPERALSRLHDGRLDAASRVADFLEALPAAPRRGSDLARGDSGPLGITREQLTAALRRLHPGGAIDAVTARWLRLRTAADCDIHVVVASFLHDGAPASERLWVARYRSSAAAAAAVAGEGRDIVLHTGAAVFERAGSEADLPEIPA